MATKKLDLNKIRDEIDKERQVRTAVPSHLGESVRGKGVAPRDEFLHGLIESLNSGRATPSSNLIKVVENKITEKHGGIAKHKIDEVAAPVQTQRPTLVDMSPERDEQLFRDLEAKRKQTLAESISNFQGNASAISNQPVVNYNGSQFLTSVPANAHVGGTMQINEGALVENVKNVVNNYLTENLGLVFEEAIKGTIIEMYAVERIKEVLNENRDLIKAVVIETIREIQAKNKAKAQ
jgi:hypothetical protein